MRIREPAARGGVPARAAADVAASEGRTSSTRTVRHEYMRALVEQSWARPGSPRPVARPHVILMVAVFAAAAAVGVGVLLQLINPIARPKPAVVAPPPASLVPFTAVNGWDCAQGSDRGFEVSGRTSAWYTVALGGWGEDGCHGTFVAIPMTGDKAKDDPDQFAVWWFTPTAGLAQCDIQVFRPHPDRPRDSGATAAQFYVLAGRNGSRLAGFVLNQAAEPGSWADVGQFPVSESGIAVQLVDRGLPASAGDRLGVAQVRVRCTP